LRSGVAHISLSARTGDSVPDLGWCVNDGYSQVSSLPTPRELVHFEVVVRVYTSVTPFLPLRTFNRRTTEQGTSGASQGVITQTTAAPLRGEPSNQLEAFSYKPRPSGRG
jgi:hypothetical protein